MNQNSTEPGIMMHSKPSKFISDEERKKIMDDVPIGHLSEVIKRTEEVCRQNMKKMLKTHYERLVGIIGSLSDHSPERKRFLEDAARVMKEYIDDTLAEGTENDTYYLLCYMLEEADEIADVTIDERGILHIGKTSLSFENNSYTTEGYEYLCSADERKKAIEGILHTML